MTKSPIGLALQVGAILDELGVDWVLGGSLASSMFGEPRATVDVDLAISIDPDAFERLLERVRHDFYVPESAARAAGETHGAFNLIDNEHGLKIDVFVLGDALLDRRQVERRLRVDLGEEQAIWVTAPEDQVLRKLDWYRNTQMTSDRQWRDVIGLLTVQGDSMDRVYLEETARSVGLAELLTRALDEADRLR